MSPTSSLVYLDVPSVISWAGVIPTQVGGCGGGLGISTAAANTLQLDDRGYRLRRGRSATPGPFAPD
jgi:hypothetical protein